MITHDQTVRICRDRDADVNALIFYISFDANTFKLCVTSQYWSGLNDGERYCIVKNGNLFDSFDACDRAIKRALG